jgi:coenzyme F420-0:L-glutamate ligase/coenzyme F420-1:gamma-L-glutamate ligase
LPKKTDRPSTVLLPIKLPTVKVGEPLDQVVLLALTRHRLRLRKGNVVAIASKVVATCEGRMQKLSQVRVSRAAKRVSRKWNLDERLATIVLEEANEILGGVPGFLLTIKNRILTANAGVDLKNCPPGSAILWPEDADSSAMRLRESLESNYGVRLGVIVVDSRVTPMRLGTIGLAIGASGLLPVRDLRGAPDIYGRKIMVTQTNVVDDLAASAHLLMGEASERIGMVIVRDAPVPLSSAGSSRRAYLNPDRCLITSKYCGKPGSLQL